MLEKYDLFLKSQSIHNSPLKALLRENNADTMSQMSTAAISERESSMLKSRQRANEFCSFLCAYRLLDIIVHGIATVSTRPPLHKKMGMNILKNEVRIKLPFHTIYFTRSRKPSVPLEIGRQS